MQSMLLKLLRKKWKPHDYQKKAVKFLLDRGAAALFLDPGLGKTSISLSAFASLKKKGILGKVLLIAPLRVCYTVWPGEIEKWEEFSGLTYTMLHGPHKEKLLQQEVDLYIINPEGLEWLLGVTKTVTKSGKIQINVDLKRWRSFGFNRLLVDELTKLKNYGSNRFKALKCVLQTFVSRWGLTGSPAANGLIDLFGQCYILDEGHSLGQYITQYRKEYFMCDHSGFVWTPAPGAEDRIFNKLKPLALRMSAGDYLKVPKRIENPIMVTLPPDAMKIYREVENDLISDVKGKLVMASNAAGVWGKCHQIANGGCYASPDMLSLVKGIKPSKRESLVIHNAKTEALADLIEELQGQPLLVAYEFHHDLERLFKTFGDDVPVIGSKVNPKTTAKYISNWNEGKTPLMFIHPASGAHGLDGLQHAGCHVAFYSVTVDFDLYDQLIHRLERQGSDAAHVFVHLLIAAGTIDEDIINALAGKNGGQQALFKALDSFKQRRVQPK